MTKRQIGKRKMKLIAETAWHHQGEFEFMHKLVGTINGQTAADIVKLHLTLDFDEYMAPDHPLYKNLKKWLFTKDQWKEIIELIVSSDKELLLLFNDTKAVEFGMQFNPTHVEIHSVCLNDIKLLAALRQNIFSTTKVVLGVGGSTLYEIENAINMLQHKEIVLMFGFQNYPTRYENINFARMRRIMGLFPECEFGYADHTAWNEPNNVLITLLGASQGVQYVEKHVTIAYGEKRADWEAAIDIDTFNQLSEKVNIIERCSGDGMLRLSQGELDYSVFGPMKKAALLKEDVKAGDKIDEPLIEFKRTAQWTDLSQIDVLQSMGSKVFSRDLKKGAVISKGCLAKKG